MGIPPLLLFSSSRFLFLALPHTFQSFIKRSPCCNRYGNQPPDRHTKHRIFPFASLISVSQSLKPLFVLSPSKPCQRCCFLRLPENGNHIHPIAARNVETYSKFLLGSGAFATVFLLGITRDINMNTMSWYWAVAYHMWVIPRARLRFEVG